MLYDLQKKGFRLKKSEGILRSRVVAVAKASLDTLQAKYVKKILLKHI